MWEQWRSQVIGIGRAPAVRQPISVALARDCVTQAARTWCFGRARVRPGPPFATPLSGNIPARRNFTSHQIPVWQISPCCRDMEFEEPETGHARTIDYNSKLELKKTRSRNPGRPNNTMWPRTVPPEHGSLCSYASETFSTEVRSHTKDCCDLWRALSKLNRALAHLHHRMVVT